MIANALCCLFYWSRTCCTRRARQHSTVPIGNGASRPNDNTALRSMFKVHVAKSPAAVPKFDKVRRAPVAGANCLYLNRARIVSASRARHSGTHCELELEPCVCLGGVRACNAADPSTNRTAEHHSVNHLGIVSAQVNANLKTFNNDCLLAK